MALTRVVRDSEPFLTPLERVVASLGNFDGVHLGHQAILMHLSRLRENYGPNAKIIVVSFDPHPAVVLGKQSDLAVLTTTEQKREILSQLGVDLLYLINFTTEFAKITAEQFVKEIIFQTLNIYHLCVGPDAAVGRGREGGREFLGAAFKEAGRIFEVLSFKELGGQRISSAQIRKLILSGQVAAAKNLLGREYRLCAEVVRGDGRGSKLGFRTANLGAIQQLIPDRGVYACSCKVKDQCYKGVVNIGLRPTFNGQNLVVETHLIDYQGADFYGLPLQIDFIQKLRDEMKFEAVTDLIEQIKLDVNQARALSS